MSNINHKDQNGQLLGTINATAQATSVLIVGPATRTFQVTGGSASIQRKDLIKNLAVKKTRALKIVTLGDSNTQRDDVSGKLTATVTAPNPSAGAYTPLHKGATWAQYLPVISGGRVELVNNAGLASDILQGMDSRLQPDVLAFNPDVVLVMGGTNDIGYQVNIGGTTRSRTPDEIVALQGGIITKLKAAGVIAVLVSIPPWSGDQFAADKVAAVNAATKAYALAQGIPYIDAYADVKDASGGFQAGLSMDNVHLNAGPGQRAWAASVWRQMQALGLVGQPLSLETVNDNPSNRFVNPLALWDPAAEYFAGGFGDETGTQAGTVTTQPRADGVGNWTVFTRTGGDADSTYSFTHAISKAGLSAGDLLEVTGDIETSVEAGKAVATLGITRGDTFEMFAAPLQRWPGDVKGTFRLVFPVPAGVPDLSLSVQISNGPGVVKLGRTRVRVPTTGS